MAIVKTKYCWKQKIYTNSIGTIS